MNTIKSASDIIAKVKERIYSTNFMEKNRTSKKYFTRKRKLPFASLVLFMLNLIKQTLQKELTHFIKQFSSKDTGITKSAFSQSRLKLKPEAFIELNDVLIEEFYTDNDELRWFDFRLLAIDTSTLDLPNSEDIINNFGSCHNTGEVITPKARISSFYDLLNELIIDSNITHYETGEYNIALKHIPKCNSNDLLIFDRGFGAIWFMYYLLSNNIDFLIRVQKNFIIEIDEFLESKEKSKIILIEKCHRKSEKRLRNLGVNFKPFKIRLVKVQLDNDETEVLVTSLMDSEKYADFIFKDLYFKRWGVEINIDHLKNKIEIENFTGLSEQAIKQDFYANSFINNLQSIIARDSQPAINEAKRNTEYRYKVNRNLSLGYMKDRVIKILTSNNPKYMEELKELFQIEPVPIREGRKNPRNFHKLRRRFNMNNRRAI
jgi:hypothetical protein